MCECRVQAIGDTVCEYACMQVDLSKVRFRDDKAREKMILLAGRRRYNASSNTLTLVGNRCPTRKQNKDYLIYLMKVLYLESHVSQVTSQHTFRHYATTRYHAMTHVQDQ